MDKCSFPSKKRWVRLVEWHVSFALRTGARRAIARRATADRLRIAALPGLRGVLAKQALSLPLLTRRIIPLSKCDVQQFKKPSSVAVLGGPTPVASSPEQNRFHGGMLAKVALVETCLYKGLGFRPCAARGI